MHSKVRNIPRNTQLRGRLFDKWPRKGLSGACCGPSGEVSGAPTGRGPACSAARDGDGQGVLRWSRGGTSAFSGAGQGGAGGSAVEPGGGASVFSGAGRGRCRGFCGGAGAGPARSAVGPGAGRGRNRRGFCGAGGGGPACSAARDRGGTGSSEVQTGRAGRRVAKKVFRREDAPAARTQKKCSEGKVRRRPNTYGHKKNGPRSVHFYFCYTTLLLYGLLLRDARPIHPAARQRLRTPGARLFCGRLPAACSPATACLPSISVCPSVGGHSRESLRHPEPQPLSRPPVGAQPPGRRNLSRPGSPRESLRPPPGSQFSAARGHSSQPSGVSAVRSPELAVPAARPLRRRGHSTTTSVWPSTCNWRISCVELT